MYCRFEGLYALRQFSGEVVGILNMQVPRLQRGHMVAVDEFGVIDPADNAPDHIALDDYIRIRSQEGFEFDEEWLAVRNLTHSQQS